MKQVFSLDSRGIFKNVCGTTPRKIKSLALPEEQIKKIENDVLMVHGKDDLVIPYKETSLRLLELLPNSEFHIFSKCGHWTKLRKKMNLLNYVKISFFETKNIISFKK